MVVGRFGMGAWAGSGGGGLPDRTKAVANNGRTTGVCTPKIPPKQQLLGVCFLLPSALDTLAWDSKQHATRRCRQVCYPVLRSRHSSYMRAQAEYGVPPAPSHRSRARLRWWKNDGIFHHHTEICHQRAHDAIYPMLSSSPWMARM